MNLRPYQHKLRDDIRAEFEAGHRCVLGVMPTGAGKSLTFIDMAIRAINLGRKVCIVVPRRVLIKQLIDTLNEFNIPHGVICSGYAPARHMLLQVATAPSLANRIHKHKFHFIIIDEVHHAMAKTWLKIINGQPDAHILGVTATPCRLDGKPLRDAGYTAMVVGPDVRWLTDNGYLCPARVYSVGGMSRKGMAKRGGDFEKSALERASKAMIVGDVLDHYRRYAHRLPGICFCVSVAEAQRWADEFRQAGYRAEAIDGSMKDGMRARLIGALTNHEIDLLMSCDLISEGVDVPRVECIIDLRSTASMCLHRQKLGRGLRMFPGKRELIVLDHAGNCAEHGLPDTEYEWSLESKAAVRRSEPDPDVVTVRYCAVCLSAHKTAPTCPFCGYVYPLQSRTVDEVAGELELLDAAYEAAGKRAEEWACKTLEDYQRVAAERGYQPGWAWHRWQSKQRKSA